MTDPKTATVAVIGAGPAGVSAATELRRLGVGTVIVLDRDTAGGGIPRFCGHSPFGLREFRRLYRGPAYARRLLAEAVTAGVDIRTKCTVLAIQDGPVLTVATPTGIQTLAVDRVVLATGCREATRVARGIGGTKPAGVVTAGTLQAMVYGSGLRPFRSPVILGTELIAFSSLLTAFHIGARPVAMIENRARATARFPAPLLPWIRGVPVLTGTEVIAIEGRDQVQAVVLRDARGDRRMICDGVITTGGFRPDAVLLRDAGIAADPATGGPQIDGWGRTSRPEVFAAGNVLRGAETAGWCWDEGRKVARFVARSLAGDLPEPNAPVTLGDGPLAWAVPQAPTVGGLGVSLRVTRPTRGRIVATGGDGDAVSFSVNSLPERRIAIDPAALPAGPVTLDFVDEAP